MGILGQLSIVNPPMTLEEDAVLEMNQKEFGHVLIEQIGSSC